MNQIAMLSVQRGLKLRKTTVVKLNMGKVDQLIRNNFGTTPVTGSISTLPQCDSTTVTVSV